MSKKALIHLVIIIISLPFLDGCVSSQKENVAPGTQFAENNIRDYLSRVAGEITDKSLANIHSIEDWQKARDRQYAEYIEMMGIQDYLKEERTDLNVKVTGRIQCDGYRIDKLYYESLPGLYVPANLYVPDGIKSPTPAILYVCGHSPTQKVRYQPYPTKLAKLGFVCLIIETIQWGEVRGDHWGEYARGWFNWYSRGYNPAGVELWNGIRGIDLLESLPEVDQNNIGVTGISGGGSQSWYIAAADSRVKAAAPVCGASTLKAQIGKRTIDGHCDCMMPINTYQVDFQDIGALIAPRPLLIAQANRDELNTIESVRGLYSDIKRIYGLYGNPEDVSLVETPGRHSYHKKSRTAIHVFFLKYLMGKDVTPEVAGDIDTTKENLLSVEDLQVYTDGIPKDDRTTKIQDSFIQIPGTPEITTEQELIAYRDSVKDFLKIKTFGAFPENEVPFDSSLYFRSVDYSSHEWDIYSFTSEEGWRLKIDLRWRNDKSEDKPLMIVLKNFDQGRWDSESLVKGLSKDWNVAHLEVRGVGENGWDPALQWHVRRASAWTGRTIASMQVYDLLRAIKFCRTIDGVEPSKIGIAAQDEMAVVALYAALLDGNCSQLLLKNPPATQDVAGTPDGKGEAIEMLNCLRITDVSQLPALIAPTQTVFVGDIPENYDWSINLLSKLDGIK
jgi:cephalosporin-C deacetylase-like acetyl esterase